MQLYLWQRAAAWALPRISFAPENGERTAGARLFLFWDEAEVAKIDSLAIPCGTILVFIFGGEGWIAECARV